MAVYPLSRRWFKYPLVLMVCVLFITTTICTTYETGTNNGKAEVSRSIDKPTSMLPAKYGTKIRSRLQNPTASWSSEELLSTSSLSSSIPSPSARRSTSTATITTQSRDQSSKNRSIKSRATFDGITSTLPTRVSSVSTRNERNSNTSRRKSTPTTNPPLTKDYNKEPRKNNRITTQRTSLSNSNREGRGRSLFVNDIPIIYKNLNNETLKQPSRQSQDHLKQHSQKQQTSRRGESRLIKSDKENQESANNPRRQHPREPTNTISRQQQQNQKARGWDVSAQEPQRSRLGTSKEQHPHHQIQEYQKLQHQHQQQYQEQQYQPYNKQQQQQSLRKQRQQEITTLTPVYRLAASELTTTLVSPLKSIETTIATTAIATEDNFPSVTATIQEWQSSMETSSSSNNGIAATVPSSSSGSSIGIGRITEHLSSRSTTSLEHTMKKENYNSKRSQHNDYTVSHATPWPVAPSTTILSNATIGSRQRFSEPIIHHKQSNEILAKNFIKTRTTTTTTVPTLKRTTTTRSITLSSSTTAKQKLQTNNYGKVLEFWQFIGAQSVQPAVTQKPPKKYTNHVYSTPANHFNIPHSLQSEVKSTKSTKTTPKSIFSSTSTTSKPMPTTYNSKSISKAIIKTTTAFPIDGPIRIALPFLPIQQNSNPNKVSARRSNLATEKPLISTKKTISNVLDKDKRQIGEIIREKQNCPRENEVRFQLFPKICKLDADCEGWQGGELCCEIFGTKSCANGVTKPLEESSHVPLLGVIPRRCPQQPLAELWWEVKTCSTDADCWPRVCCPDGPKRYCRTSQPELETVPVVPVPVQRSLNYLSEYLQCTPPPPVIFDLHPKHCNSTLDCFPNVCCQEAGLRHCRPPKKSVLTMLANVFNVDFVKRITQNIVIK